MGDGGVQDDVGVHDARVVAGVFPVLVVIGAAVGVVAVLRWGCIFEHV